jgi:cytochrome P450
METKNFIELRKKLVSPLGSSKSILEKIKEAQDRGLLHILYNNYSTFYGLSSNMVIPYYDEYHSKLTELVIINNPEDVEKILMKHTKKTPYLKYFVYDSIISTTDVNHWTCQRRHYQSAFSVNNELKKLIPLINARAILSIDILNKTRTCDEEFVNIYEFFLNETMAQLQLAMFGFSNEFQEETNFKIREAFLHKDLEYGIKFVTALFKEIQTSNGPLSVAMKNRDNSTKTKNEDFGNALIFSFAGHDTTANTLTWLIYELCKNKYVFQKLLTEVDNFWLEHGEQNIIEYDDLKKLKYMTRCITEILRLWTAIPLGTSRELIEDDYIIGKNGKLVKIPKGTYIQVPNWTRHRNPKLWGKDVNSFNPDRDFVDEEIFNDMGLASYNPYSSRFSPFTYGPRDCIGKNFSQIEMRISLLHLLKNFCFSLPKKQLTTYNQDTISINLQTLGPRNIYNNNLYQNKLGMYVNLIKRNMNSKL